MAEAEATMADEAGSGGSARSGMRRLVVAAMFSDDRRRWSSHERPWHRAGWVRACGLQRTSAIVARPFGAGGDGRGRETAAGGAG